MASSKPTKKLEVIAELSLPISLVVLLIAGALFAMSYFDKDSSSVSSSLTERNLAIQQAQRNGESTYEYKTNFIPGIGKVGDPGKVKEDFEAQQELK